MQDKLEARAAGSRLAHKDCSCCLQGKVGESWELVTYSFQGIWGGGTS